MIWGHEVEDGEFIEAGVLGKINVLETKNMGDPNLWHWDTFTYGHVGRQPSPHLFYNNRSAQLGWLPSKVVLKY